MDTISNAICRCIKSVQGVGGVKGATYGAGDRLFSVRIAECGGDVGGERGGV